MAAGGTFTLTAANGDQLVGTCTALIPNVDVIGDVIVAEGDLTVTNGTGRFEGATGTATVTFFIVFEGFGDLAWDAAVTWTGALSY